MADIPVGARLEYGPGGPRGDARAPWPVVVVRNVWVLPGVPSIFRRKFEAVRELFRAGPIHGPPSSRAPARAHRGRHGRGGQRFPEVEIGSYPHLEALDYRVKITLDGRDAAAVDAALAWLAARLGDAVVRTE